MKTKIVSGVVLVFFVGLLVGSTVGFYIGISELDTERTIPLDEMAICYSPNCTNEQIILFVEENYAWYDDFDNCYIRFVANDGGIRKGREIWKEEKSSLRQAMDALGVDVKF